jgi:hypothetical protein
MRRYKTASSTLHLRNFGTAVAKFKSTRLPFNGEKYTNRMAEWQTDTETKRGQILKEHALKYIQEQEKGVETDKQIGIQNENPSQFVELLSRLTG